LKKKTNMLFKKIVVTLLAAWCGYALVIKSFKGNKVGVTGNNLQLTDRRSNSVTALCAIIAWKLNNQYLPAQVRINVSLEWVSLGYQTIYNLVKAVAHINACVTGDDPIGQTEAAFDVADDIGALLLLAFRAVNGVGVTVLRRRDEQLDPISRLSTLHGGIVISVLMRLQTVLMFRNTVAVIRANQGGTIVTLCYLMFRVLFLEVMLYLYTNILITLSA
jgi:hypothetical protein